MGLKRLSNAVLAVMMVGYNFGGVIPVMASDAVTTVQNEPSVELEDGVVLSKTVKSVEGYANKWEVKLRIEAPITKTTSDTVLVIDRSGSMQGDRLAKAKEAAVSLVEQLLPDGNTTNEVAVVSYGTNVTVDSAFSKDASVVSSAIDNIVAGGGTFTQGGLHQAVNLINSSSANYKNIILLSDGAPSYSYNIKNLSINNSSSFEEGGPGIQTYEFKTKIIDSPDKFNYDSVAGDGSVTTGDPKESEMWDYIGRKCRDYGWLGNCLAHDYFYYDHGNAAISEANFYKNSNVGGLYTIAFNAGPKGQTVLENMAENGKYYAASESNLKEIFDKIAGKISSLITSSSVHDVMGQGVKVSGASGAAADAIDWVPEFKQEGDKYVAEYTYPIELTEDIYEQTSTNGFYDANKSAVLTYNGDKTGTFPVPKIKPFAIHVEKELVTKNEEGVEKVVDGQDFKFKISGNNKTYNIKSGVTGTIKVPMPIKLGTTYTVTEEAWVPENSDIKFENYNVEYTNNTFVVTENHGDEISVKIKNTYETTSIDASKVWNDDNDRDGLRKNYANLYVAVKDGDEYVAAKKVAQNNENYHFGNLPKNRDGQTIAYSIVEAKNCQDDNGDISCEEEFINDGKYKAEINNGVITNTHVPEKVKFTIKKKWDISAGTLPTVTPGFITVDISNDKNDKVSTVELRGEAYDTWAGEFEDYKFYNGEEINYFVTEKKIGESLLNSSNNTLYIYKGDALEGKWVASYNGTEVTNTWTPAKTVYTGSGEFYINKLDQSGQELSGVTFTVGDKTYTTADDGKVKVEFSKSDERPEDKYTFNITETEAPDYYDMIQGTEVLEATTNLDLNVDVENLTNTYTKIFTYKEKEAVNGYNWQDNDKTLIVTNQALAKELKIEKTFEGITTDAFKNNSNITFTISGPKGFKETTLGINDEECGISGNKLTCVLSGSDVSLPIGEYTVTENNANIENFTYESEPTNGKVSQTVGLGETAEFAIKNVYTPATKEITIKKIWDVTSGSLPTVAPTFITVELSNDKNTDKTMITLRGNGYDEWRSETLIVPAYDDNGDAISYEVKETGINAENNLTGGNNDLCIYNGEALEGKWTTGQPEQLAVNNAWKPATSIYEGEASFDIVKIDEKGRALEGVIFTVNGEDYTTDKDGNIKVEAELSTAEAEENKTFVISEKSTLNGYDLVTGTATLEMTCKSVLKSIDEEKLLNTYTKNCEFKQNFNKTTNPAYDWNGETNTLTVVNNRSMADTLVIRKEISGVTGAALRNNGLKFTLTGPSDFESQEIMFSEFTKIADGIYEYSVEGKIPTGEYKVVESGAEFEGLLTLAVSGDNDVTKELTSREDAVFTIKNDYSKIRDVSYSVAKIWNDANDKDGKRPDELQITLLRDGEKYRTAILDARNGWIYEWDDLPRASEEAVEYVYSAVEAEVEGYESDGGEMVDGTFTFTNSHEPEPEFEPGYGSEVMPLAPETGKLTNTENGSSLGSEVCSGIGIVAFASFGVIWVVARRKKNTTSNK